MAVPDYQIVVPSRKRSHNMETIRWLLPTAKICVDVREYEQYEAIVGKECLLVHPPIDGLPGTINWIMDNVDSEVLVEIDDDFCGVKVNVGSKRFITDAEEILAIIENAMICTKDLGLTAFCWSRTQNTTIIHPEVRPIVPTQSVCNAFGLMGAARTRHYDTSMLGRADVDWTLRTLLADRCVYADVRFYFDCGRVFGGRGGNVSLVTPEIFKNSTRAILDKWGNAVSFKKLPFQKNRDVAAVRLAVSRTNRDGAEVSIERESLLMLTLPNSGSTWLGNLIAKHSKWNRYYPEYFNPIRNRPHYQRLSANFGCELVSCYRNIARGGEFDEDIDLTWGTEDWNFTKEVFSPFKLDAFRRRFNCFVLLRDEDDTFPPKRLRVWSFYEHAYWAMREVGIILDGITFETRAINAFRLMQEQLVADADRLDVPVIRYRELFGAGMQEKVAESIGECTDELATAIESSRVLCARSSG